MASGLPSVQSILYPSLDCLGCGDMSGSLKDHRLEDDGLLRVPLYVMHPLQLSHQSLHKASPDLPAWRVIAPRWHDHEVTPPPLPRLVVPDSAVEVCARVGVNPVSVDLPKTEFLRGRCVSWHVNPLPLLVRRF